MPFTLPTYAEVLDTAERAELLADHPDGLARFWGATPQHDRRMDTLDAGDVVLLTGQKHVRAIGTIGCRLRNDELARRLWDPDPARCLWRNVYRPSDWIGSYVHVEPRHGRDAQVGREYLAHSTRGRHWGTKERLEAA